MRKPENLAPGEGSRVELTTQQLESIQKRASELGAADVSIEDRGERYLSVAAFDGSGSELDRWTEHPLPFTG